MSYQTFLELLKAGLWEDVGAEKICTHTVFSEYSKWEKVCQLATEQSVTGLIVAGIERLNVDVPMNEKLQLIGMTVQQEQSNKAMNGFIEHYVGEMYGMGLSPLLVKGQGIAQCYNRPLWRTNGDVDLLINERDYDKAIEYLTGVASETVLQNEGNKEYGFFIEDFEIELHGSLRCGLSKVMDNLLDIIFEDSFKSQQTRTWQVGSTSVKIPSANDDVIFVFTHILKHFYKGGIGLRQICDWCRLLWSCKAEIDLDILEKRLERMKIMDEWQTFATLAVDVLGMPKEAMPFYCNQEKWKRKAVRVFNFVMKVGNFGRNRDFSYYRKYPFLIRKSISLSWRVRDIFTHSRIFPKSAILFLPIMIFDGIHAVFSND